MNASTLIPVTKITGNSFSPVDDLVATEEPLEIRINYVTEGAIGTKNLAVTMRTPGNDHELALGFLFTEGIVQRVNEVETIDHVPETCRENRGNVIVVKLKAGAVPNLSQVERNFYTTSSCGVCGKGSISAIYTLPNSQVNAADDFLVTPELLYCLPGRLAACQEIFSQTGGLHAAALFSAGGELLLVREDVGRHNALDKLIGAALSVENISLHQCILLLSGRAGFELVQKAAMAGIPCIAAVGAPSSLAVSLANEFGITLAGFLRSNRCNLYSAPQRIQMSVHENSH
jgi:FdhD protein